MACRYALGQKIAQQLSPETDRKLFEIGGKVLEIIMKSKKSGR